MTILLCASVAMSMLASEPLGASSQRTNEAQVSNSSIMAVGESVTMQRFMRERGLTPDDNRLARRAPRRQSVGDMTGDRIAMVEIRDGQETRNVNWIAPLIADEGNDLVKLENFCTVDINVAADAASYTEDFFFGTDGLIPIDLPIELDFATGAALLRTDVPVYHDEVTATDPINDKVKITKTTDVFLVLSETGMLTGVLYDEGSIMFNRAFLISTRLVYKTKIASAVNYDTVYVESPVFSDLCLMMPNGVHQYKEAIRINPGGGSGGWSRTDFETHSFVSGWGVNPPYEGLGVGGRKPVKPGSPGSGDISGLGSGQGQVCGVGDDVSFMRPDNSNGNSGAVSDGVGRGSIIHGYATDNEVADINGVGGRRPAKPGKPGKTTGEQGGRFQTGHAGSSTEANASNGDNGMRLKKIFHETAYVVQGRLIIDAYGPCGVGGRKPVKPGNSNIVFVGSSNAKNNQVDNSPYANQHDADYGGGGGNGGNGSSGDILRTGNTGQNEVPVYVFQADDDGLVYMCNLYGNSLVNYMSVNPDGTVSFPSQLIGENCYNYSDYRSPGCTGMAEEGMISWGKTVPVVKQGDILILSLTYYADNCVTFADGVPFMRAPVANITAVTSKINDVLNGNGNITEVTTLINEMLNAE